MPKPGSVISHPSQRDCYSSIKTSPAAHRRHLRLSFCIKGSTATSCQHGKSGIEICNTGLRLILYSKQFLKCGL